MIKMKSCIILFCLLAVVYSEGVGEDKSLQEHKDLLLAKAEAGKNLISSFLTNISALVEGIADFISNLFTNVWELVEGKVDVYKNVISSFFTNILKPASLQGLTTQLVEWILYVLFTVIVAQLSA